MQDAISALAAKAQLSEDTVKKTRFFDAHSGRIYRELAPDHSVSHLNEWITIYADTSAPADIEPGQIRESRVEVAQDGEQRRGRSATQGAYEQRSLTRIMMALCQFGENATIISAT